VPLTAIEETTIRVDVTESELRFVHHDEFQLLAGDTFYLPPQGPETQPEQNVFFSGSKAGEVGKRLGLLPLTPAQKETYLTDIKIYDTARISNFLENDNVHRFGVHTYGSRNLTAEQQPDFGTELFINSHYGYSRKEFLEILQDVRLAQGKNPTDTLWGLDIGGSYGRGAYDAEALDSNLTMTNLTVTPEMAYYPLRGGTRILPAERMPAAFAEQFDIITSNFAFPYMRYPDLGLENGLRALKKGGIMSVSFGSRRNNAANSDESNTTTRINRQFKRMEELHEEGKIRYLPLWNPEYNDAREEWKENPTNVYGQVFLQKVA
jgi:SAM-dependent methyltransferase